MRRTLLTLALCVGMSQTALAQEQDHAPWLNAFGRFWGIGYSAGYHAQTNSRLGLHHYSPGHNVVPEPPRGMHANPNLYVGQANAYSQYGAPQYGGSPFPPGQSPTPAPVPASATPQNMVPPPKPVDPPPNWLKQYMKPNVDAEKARQDELLNEASPSDRKGVMLAPSLEDSTTSLSITPAQPAPTQIGGRPIISVLQQ